jgi:type I restriction enzyme S subunit
MGNLQHGELDLSALKYLPSDRSEFPKLLLRDGDLLFNRTNSAELVGKTSVYRGNPPHCSFASYIVRVQLNGMIPEFLAAFINSIFGRRWIKSVVSQQVGQANVNSTKLRALSVPLPPLDEQQIIVDRLEDLKSGLDRARAGAEGQSFRAGSLRRSILNSAFSGRLVPQNPSDEPASELLARICLERAKAPKTTARRGRPRKTSGASEGATR